MKKPPHIPVLLKEVMEQISPKDGGIYVDGTFGAGGYTRAVLQAADCLRIISLWLPSSFNRNWRIR